MTITTPLIGTNCHQWAETSYDQDVYQICNLYIHPLQRYEMRRKNAVG